MIVLLVTERDGGGEYSHITTAYAMLLRLVVRLQLQSDTFWGMGGVMAVNILYYSLARL